MDIFATDAAGVDGGRRGIAGVDDGLVRGVESVPAQGDTGAGRGAHARGASATLACRTGTAE